MVYVSSPSGRMYTCCPPGTSALRKSLPSPEEVKDVLVPGGQGEMLEGQEVEAFLPIQKEPLEAWMGPLRGELLKEMSSSKGLAGLWRASRGAAMAEEAEARRAMVFMNFIVVLNCCLMIDDLLYLASRWFIVGLIYLMEMSISEHAPTD